MKEDKQ
jgi:hypothetical protein